MLCVRNDHLLAPSARDTAIGCILSQHCLICGIKKTKKSSILPGEDDKVKIYTEGTVGRPMGRRKS